MIYDISLPLSPALATWPGDPPLEMMAFGDHIRVSRWTLGSHAGTHVDAPIHYSAGPGTVDELDPAKLIGPCRVIDLGDVPRVTPAVLAAHDLVGVERLLLRTRNSLHWQDNATHFDPAFTALDADAAQIIVQLGIGLLGVDGLSVEPFGGDDAVHETLLGAGVIIVEGLALADVPAGAYQLLCAPLKLQGADGAPARVFLQSPA